MSLETGQIIDSKYKIVRLLGTGGMGAVYEGENTRIRRRVAIKMLHASVSSAAESVARFEREAQAAARIGSEHICEVLDLGLLDDGTRYMVMEYMDGETLASRIKRLGRLAPAQSIPLLVQVLDALGAAHAAGIVHRDLKPDNIFILPSKAGRIDFVKILDFGVSKFSQLNGEAEEFNVTRAGAVIGTPYYMSPEQARGMATVDGRSDIYAVGVVLYQATTGQVPFRAETFNELLFKIALEVPPPPQQFVPDLDPEFALIIQRAMGREQATRFQTCAEFRDALLAWSATRSAAAPVIGPGMRAPTFPPGMMATPPPGATSGPGVMPSGMATPSPFMGTPPPGSFTPPSVPNPATPAPGLEGAHATGSSWGNTSGAAAPVPKKPPSSMLLVSGLVGLVALSGIGIAAYLFLNKGPTSGGSPSAASASPSQVAVPVPVPTPPPLPPPVHVEPATTDASLVGQPAPSASTPVVSGAPSARPANMPGTTRPPVGGPLPKPSATAVTKPNKGGGPDFGY